MASFSTLQQLVRTRLLALSESNLAAPVLASEILAALNTAVPNDGMRLWLVDPATCLLSRQLATINDPPSNYRYWLRDVYLSEHDERVPYFSARRILTERIGAVAIQPDQGRSLGIPALFQARIHPTLHRNWFAETQSPRFGWSYLGLPDRTQWYGLLVTMHRTAATMLSPASFRFLHHVQPVIGSLLATMARRERGLVESAQRDEASGVLVLAANGTVTLATQPAEHWLDLLRDPAAGGRVEDHLPTAVVSARNSLRYQQAHGAALPIGRIRTDTSRGALMLEATVMDANGSVVVVITPERHQDAPALPDDWPLTMQERRIAQLIIAGNGNRQIAARLSISEATVETHIAHIYTKLEITSRTMLANAYFRATYRG